MQDVTITRIGELVEVARSLFFGSDLRWWFRGHLDAGWDLIPSVMRDFTGEQEKFLSNEFYVRGKTRYSNCPTKNDLAGWLSIMQHFGLPTRLLDWSNSPLVAAYFATEQGKSRRSSPTPKDACIWALAPGRLNEAHGLEPYLYPLDALSLRPLIRPAFKGTDTVERIAAAWAVETDPRMQVQQGAFTIHSSRTPLNVLHGHEDWLVRILIPKERVADLAEEILLLGFRRGDVFPDLDNLAKELKSFHFRFTNR